MQISACGRGPAVQEISFGCRIWMFYDSDILPMNKSVVPFGMFKREFSTCREQRTISYQS